MTGEHTEPALLEDEASPPGGWAPAEAGLKRWNGTSSWRLRRGEAVVTVTLGRWHTVDGATLPDGSPAGRIEASMENRLGVGDAWIADAPDGERRIHGRISESPAGIVFTPDEGQPTPATTWRKGDERDLRDDLAADPGFRGRVLDTGFATALYLAFENRAYALSGTRFSMSFRTAGAFVADVRGLGEEYIDFYCARHTGENIARAEALAAEVQSAIAKAGWHPYDAGDAAEDAARVSEIIAIAERRRPGERPGWAPRSGEEAATSGVARLRNLARAGKMTAEEYRDAIDRASLSDPER